MSDEVCTYTCSNIVSVFALDAIPYDVDFPKHDTIYFREDDFNKVVLSSLWRSYDVSNTIQSDNRIKNITLLPTTNLIQRINNEIGEAFSLLGNFKIRVFAVYSDKKKKGYILDCYNGEILSLEMRNNMKKKLCIDTVKALRKYPIKGAILHSDRGSQYTSEAFRETLKSMRIKQSLSGVAHCYDNARMESFFATLKKELLYRIPTYRMTMEEVKSAVFRYVFTYYNQVRVYSRLDEKQKMPAA